MAFDTETELEAQGLECNPELDRPTAWVSSISAKLGEHREREAAAAMAQDYVPGLPVVTAPARIADELLSRARFLRSKRGGVRTKKSELQIIEELEAIAVQAEELAANQDTLGAAALSAQRTALSVNLFTVRLRYADLLAGQDLPFVVRAQPQGGEARQRELDQIEEFLARKGQVRAA